MDTCPRRRTRHFVHMHEHMWTRLQQRERRAEFIRKLARRAESPECGRVGGTGRGERTIWNDERVGWSDKAYRDLYILNLILRPTDRPHTDVTAKNLSHNAYHAA